MDEPSPFRPPITIRREQEHLEVAHHEICTALTVLQSNVELVRVELRHEHDPSSHVIVQRHLSELDLALDRLRRLAAQMRTWHAEDPGTTGAKSDLPQDARILP